ncbi:MAG: hypothetical protein FJ213_10460 [Ignavibacteria bacterium]|nr:hypothetical protein [Ignavibacteria bacterium]
MAKEVSIKSTKNELFEAYNEALEKIKELKSADRKVEKKKEEEKKIVEAVVEHSPETIIKLLGEIKLRTAKAIDEIGETLIAEYRKLTELQQAIEIEKKYLEEIFDIKAGADSLSALLLAQKEKKEAFELEIEAKRIQWKQEQENYEIQKKDRDMQIKKEREREQEEYNYNLKLQRKKDADQYAVQKLELEKELINKKAAIEKELAEREALVTAREKEFAELKAKVESFPAELDNVIKGTEKSVTEKIELKYKHQAELSSKEIEGERKLNKQMIASFESKIKEQEELIRQLTQKANDAGIQIQNIAIKAIEGASLQRSFSVPHDKDSSKS